MTETERLEIIAATIESVRPALQNDGGDIQLIAVEGDKVRVKLTGACLHCAMAGQTLGGVRRRLMDILGTPVMVVPAQDC